MITRGCPTQRMDAHATHVDGQCRAAWMPTHRQLGGQKSRFGQPQRLATSSGWAATKMWPRWNVGHPRGRLGLLVGQPHVWAWPPLGICGKPHAFMWAQQLATSGVMGGHVSAWPGPVLGAWVCCAGGHAYIVRGRRCCVRSQARVTGVQRKTWADVRTEWNPTRYTWARMDAIIACAYVGPRVMEQNLTLSEREGYESYGSEFSSPNPYGIVARILSIQSEGL